MTIGQSLATYTPTLAAISDTPRLDCEVLLAHLLQKDRAYLYTWPEKALTGSQSHALAALITRRAVGEPIAHITGYQEFWSLSLCVDRSTLIPRPETELLVETALACRDPSVPTDVLDLGTGTGAIALAIASERPDWSIVAVDQSEAAVALARRNQQRLQLNHVRIVQSDWFSVVGGQLFDVIVANPPYIDPEDPHLAQGDVRFEPRSALVAEQAGLSDLTYIIQTASDYLRPDGWLILEHGYDQGDRVYQRLVNARFRACFTQHDLAGHPRVSGGKASHNV